MRQTLRTYSLILVLIIGLFAINPVEAKRLQDVHFEEEYTVDETTLTFQGAGLIRHLFFTVNATALYVSKGFEAKDALEDIPKRLEFEYFHNIKAKDFVKLTNKLLAANNDQETIARLQPRIDRFNALYEDVRPGDRYSLTYIPGIGTEFALNGELKGTIEGTDFAQALFSIWLGQKPVSKSLKLALLKQ
jgi:hypothetical protein